MDAREHEARTVLALTPGIGAATFTTLCAHFGSAFAALETLEMVARDPRAAPAATVTGAMGAALIDAVRSGTGRRRADEAFDWAERAGQHLLVAGAPHYPAMLAASAAPPPVVFVRGDRDVLSTPSVAVVGARRASHYGLDVARWFADALGKAGLTVVSGLALGIDAAAHEAALAAGGPTVAVCGTGVDVVYPRAHERLAERIVAGGCLVSEFPLGTGARREHFPRRNRIIAALSSGVLVVEARARSGSLVTARLAAEEGREVFAVPGSVFSPGSEGCHALIRDGATPACRPDALIETLDLPRPGRASGAPAAPGAPTVTAASPDERRVLAAIGDEVVGFDRLAARTGLTAARLSSILSALELDGVLVAEPGSGFRQTRRLPHKEHRD